jgi:DNA topoisomerase II
LAQDYMGSNNYPLLAKEGQFGNILSNESSAPRYIHTKLHENWNMFFNSEDQNIVDHLYDDGDKIEPSYFIPVIPLILVNGSEGMGNGYRSKILSYNVKDISKCIREYVSDGEIETKLVPYSRGFKGKVVKADRQSVFTGVIKKINSYKLQITELPPFPSYDNDKYKKILNTLVDNKVIKDYENHSTEDGWDWVIKCGSDLSKKTLSYNGKTYSRTSDEVYNLVDASGSTTLI